MADNIKPWWYTLVGSAVVGMLGMLSGFPIVLLLCVPVSIVASIGLRAARR